MKSLQLSHKKLDYPHGTDKKNIYVISRWKGKSLLKIKNNILIR